MDDADYLWVQRYRGVRQWIRDRHKATLSTSNMRIAPAADVQVDRDVQYHSLTTELFRLRNLQSRELTHNLRYLRHRLDNLCGADWISARPKSESPKLRTDSEFNTGKSFGSRNELAENESHPRGTDSCSKDDYLQATQRCVHMINGAEGTTDQPMHDVVIIDCAAVLHCTGDINLLSEYTEREQPDGSITGASGTVMPIHGAGSICNGRFQVKDVKYIPSLNRPNINKTIFSVFELVKLDYSVHFNGPRCSVEDNRNRTWSWKTLTWTHEVVGEAHLEHGQFMVDYLRIPADRTPATTSERATFAALFWKAAASGWTRMTGLMTHQSARRPPV